jgi:hypothetical protein
LKSLLTKLDKLLKPLLTSNTLLVFDNLNLLLTSYDSAPLEYLEIFNELSSLTAVHPSLTLAIGTNRDLFPDEEVLNFYRDLKSDMFDMTIEINRNVSGYTKDVHGQMNVIRGSSVKNVKYRLTENKVEVFEHYVI